MSKPNTTNLVVLQFGSLTEYQDNVTQPVSQQPVDQRELEGE